MSAMLLSTVPANKKGKSLNMDNHIHHCVVCNISLCLPCHFYSATHACIHCSQLLLFFGCKCTFWILRLILFLNFVYHISNTANQTIDERATLPLLNRLHFAYFHISPKYVYYTYTRHSNSNYSIFFNTKSNVVIIK